MKGNEFVIMTLDEAKRYIVQLHEARVKLDIARLRAEIEAHEEICADCVKLTAALMALVKYSEIIHRWLSPANIKPYWYEDFVSDIKRAKKVLWEQKS